QDKGDGRRARGTRRTQEPYLARPEPHEGDESGAGGTSEGTAEVHDLYPTRPGVMRARMSASSNVRSCAKVSARGPGTRAATALIHRLSWGECVHGVAPAFGFGWSVRFREWPRGATNTAPGVPIHTSPGLGGTGKGPVGGPPASSVKR